MDIRLFQPGDRPAVEALGDPVIEPWQQAETLHLVVGEPAIAQLQVVDRGTTPHRRPGRFEMRLFVASGHRRQGIGSRLLEAALDFARGREGQSIRTAYILRAPDEPAISFLAARGFEDLQRYHASEIETASWDPSPFQPAVDAVLRRGFRVFWYSELTDGIEHRRRLYDLSTDTREDIPVIATEPHENEPFERWVENFASKDRDAILLAERVDPSWNFRQPGDGEWVGLVEGLDWPYTGVRHAYRGQGIATALKVLMTARAKERGIAVIHTESVEHNPAMMAIHRKLGFRFLDPEVELIRWLAGDPTHPSAHPTISPLT